MTSRRESFCTSTESWKPWTKFKWLYLGYEYVYPLAGIFLDFPPVVSSVSCIFSIFPIFIFKCKHDRKIASYIFINTVVYLYIYFNTVQNSSTSVPYQLYHIL